MEGRSVGLRRSAAAWGAGAQQAAARWWEAAQGRIMGPRMGAARSCAGAQQRGAALGRSVGLQRGAAAWGCAKVLYVAA